MKGKSGNIFLLKVGDGGSPETFTTVARLRGTSYSINGEQVNVTSKDSTDGWRDLLDGGGEKTLTISADGVFISDETQVSFRDRAIVGSIDSYQLDDGDEVIEGGFQVANFEGGGDQNAEQTFSITLESSGKPAVSDAS